MSKHLDGCVLCPECCNLISIYDTECEYCKSNIQCTPDPEIEGVTLDKKPQRVNNKAQKKVQRANICI